MGTAPGNNYHGAGSNPSAGTGQAAQGQGAAQTAHGNNANAGQGSGNPATQALLPPGEGLGRGKHDKAKASGESATNLPGNSEAGLENALASGQGHKYGIYKHLAKEGDTVNANGEIVSAGTGGTGTAQGQSDFTYYYHPDHLGSTGYVTDANGKLYEHLEYFPFGETWVQEHSNTLRTPYLFTGKEFDQETGLYYFGARYYDPRTSVWVRADPILGRYLEGVGSSDPSELVEMEGIYNPFNSALYTFGYQNPIRFTDPDGNKSITFVMAFEYNKDNPTGGAYMAISINNKARNFLGIGINFQTGTNWVSRGVTATDEEHGRAGGQEVAIKQGVYGFTVDNKGVDRNGHGKGLVPRLNEGAEIPTYGPNENHGGRHVADGVLLHSMNHNPKISDPAHGGKDYWASEACNGPADNGRGQLPFMKGTEKGDKGAYGIIRPGETFANIKSWFKSLSQD